MAVLAGFISRPGETVIRGWNWKSALLSAVVRGMLFFTANLGAGISHAIGAMSIESAFYVATAGFYGSVIQSMRRARPPWAATLAVMAIVPGINHSMEFLLHRAGGTKRIAAGIVASVIFSMFSAVFNLFAMRRGALVVGSGQQPLLDDLRRMPRLLLEFLLAAPKALAGIKENQWAGCPGEAECSRPAANSE